MEPTGASILPVRITIFAIHFGFLTGGIVEGTGVQIQEIFANPFVADEATIFRNRDMVVFQEEEQFLTGGFGGILAQILPEPDVGQSRNAKVGKLHNAVSETFRHNCAVVANPAILKVEGTNLFQAGSQVGEFDG